MEELRHLNDRDILILKHVGEGRQDWFIAHSLGTSRRVITKSARNILNKIYTYTRVQGVLWCVDNGVLLPNELIEDVNLDAFNLLGAESLQTISKVSRWPLERDFSMKILSDELAYSVPTIRNRLVEASKLVGARNTVHLAVAHRFFEKGFLPTKKPPCGGFIENLSSKILQGEPQCFFL